MQGVTQVSYTADMGPVLPELQWYLEISINRSSITLTRKAMQDESEVNAGSWEFPADEQLVSALFEQLAGVDCSTILRVAPDEPPDGGHTETFSISYGGDKRCLLMLDPGTTYTNGELVVQPIREFLQMQPFPPEALVEYNLPE